METGLNKTLKYLFFNIYFLNPYQANVLLLYPLKTLWGENLIFLTFSGGEETKH